MALAAPSDHASRCERPETSHRRAAPQGAESMDTTADPGRTPDLAAQLRMHEEEQRAFAEHRMQERASTRMPAMEHLDRGQIAAANDPLRVARRVDRVSRYLQGDDLDGSQAGLAKETLEQDAAARLDLPATPEVLLEKVINQPDFLAVRYLEGGYVAQRTVGRVVIRGSAGRVAGYGTGFFVSPRLLLTNHHVLPSAAVAASSTLELNFQRALDGGPMQIAEVRLDPEGFFLADKTLDFALVEVVGAPAASAPFGWCRLTSAQGTVVVGECVSIVQHPAGREKEVVLRENKLVDIADPGLHYVADTEPGSSGSPVFNDQWEVIALHHASVPDSRVTPGDTPAAADGAFVNEGIRISRILAYLDKADLDPGRRALVDEIRATPHPHGQAGSGTEGTQVDGVVLGEVPTEGVPGMASAAAGDGAPGGGVTSIPAAPSPAPAVEADTVSIDVPLHLTISFGLGVTSGSAPSQQVTPVRGAVGTVAAPSAPGPVTPLAAVTPGAGTPPAGPVPAAAVESLSIDPDYSTRGGYDPEFLGTMLPLPGVGSNAAVASAELRYHHFSVVMHRERRLALYTAVNIDGSQTDARPRTDDRWILDPRLPRVEQTGADVYEDNALDRGHLVRRLDPAWGPLARAANDDTFHYTNSAPQHHAFNAGSTLWLGLEEYVLGTARRDRLRVSVCSGPIYDPDDPSYRGVLLPRQFFKIVAVVDEADRLVVTGYVLGQDAFLPSVLEEAAFGAYRTFQVRVSMIAALTGLDLAPYVAADPLAAQEATAPAHVLHTYADIVLGS